MAVKKHPPPTRVVEEDLEATAELPVIDFAAGAEGEPALSESAVATDVFPTPVLQVGAVELADSLRDVEQRLQRKQERVQRLEGELAAAQAESEHLREQLASQIHAAEAREAALKAEAAAQAKAAAGREAQLQAELAAAGQRQVDAQRTQDALRDELAALREQLHTQRAVLSESQVSAEQRRVQQLHQQRELEELRRRCERQLEALSGWQGFRGVSEAMIGEAEAALATIEGRHAAELAGWRSRFADLETRSAGVAAESAARLAQLEDSLKAAQAAHQALSESLAAAVVRQHQADERLTAREAELAAQAAQLQALRATEDKAREGAALHDEHVARIAELVAEAEAARQRVQESEEQLRAAGERLHRLEAEALAGAALLGNLQQNIERLGREDTGSRPVLQPPPPETVVRVLIRQDGGSDVVYPVSRRTTVGRTPENDIQVNTTFVSRHHAVLLSGPDHCIVEDLNSTNGVLVNGHRVTRQILRDGDMVTIGRTEFKYQQRS